MPRIKVAHLREQGQNMLIFPLDSNFHTKSEAAKQDILEELQMRASAAGLAGRAVIFWQNGSSTHFMGPRPWHPFLKGLSLRQVHASLNKEISW